MLTIEWLKDDKPIHRMAMLDVSMAIALDEARARATEAKAVSGIEPDSVRVTDHLINRTVIEQLLPPE